MIITDLMQDERFTNQEKVSIMMSNPEIFTLEELMKFAYLIIIVGEIIKIIKENTLK